MPLADWWYGTEAKRQEVTRLKARIRANLEENIEELNVLIKAFNKISKSDVQSIGIRPKSTLTTCSKAILFKMEEIFDHRESMMAAYLKENCDLLCYEAIANAEIPEEETSDKRKLALKAIEETSVFATGVATLGMIGSGIYRLRTANVLRLLTSGAGAVSCAILGVDVAVSFYGGKKESKKLDQIIEYLSQLLQDLEQKGQKNLQHYYRAMARYDTEQHSRSRNQKFA